MKQISKYIKEVGIVLSYTFILVACYFFDGKPFGIFISYLIEVVALFLIYSLLRWIDEKKHPKLYRKSQPLMNLFIGLIPVVIFQYFIIGWISSFINPEENFFKQNLFLSSEVFYIIGSVVVFYSIKALQISNHKVNLRIFQDNFLFNILALSGANIIGFVLVIGFHVDSLLPVLSAMVIFRILLEIYFVRKMNLA